MIRHGLRTTLLLTIGATIISCNLYGRKSGKGKLYLDGAPNTEAKAKTTLRSEADTAPTDYEIPALRKNSGEIILHRKGYTVSYNPTTKIPNWVAWHLTADHTSGQAKRKGVEFHEDTDVPEPRANTFDYMQSGYDRGHICPSADRQNSKDANEQTFYLSNMQPQINGFNAGVWMNMEDHLRNTWNTSTYRDILYVCKGGTIDNTSQIAGYTRNSKLIVPKYFFAAILAVKNGQYKAIGLWFEHKKNSDKNLSNYIVSIDELEKLTGIDFFCNLPDSIENKVESATKAEMLSDWGLK